MAAESSSEKDVMSGKSGGKKSKWVADAFIETRKAIIKEISIGPPEGKEQRFEKKSFEFFDEDLKYYRSKQHPIERNWRSTEEWPVDKKCSYARNIYQMLLSMIKHMPDKKKAVGKQMCLWLMKNFITWIEKRGDEKELAREFLDTAIQKRAVHSGFHDPEHSQLLCRIFHVDARTVRQIVVESIGRQLESRDFKEAADLAIRYEIVDEYSFEQIALPLILCDKTQVMMEMLKVSPNLQKKYLKFLDSLIDLKDEEVIEVFRPYQEKHLITIGLDRFFGKSLISFMHKFFNGPAKQFNFELDEARDAPNFDTATKKRALMYYVRLRYENKDISDAMYFQHMKSVLAKKQSNVIEAVLENLWKMDRRDTKVDALSLVIYFNVPKTASCVPSCMKKFLDKPDEAMMSDAENLIQSRMSEDMFKYEEELLVCHQGREYPIRMVKNIEEFEELLSVFTALDEENEPVYVGIDCEMKPAHLVDTGLYRGCRTSLVQFFFREKAWVVDCIALDHQQMPVAMWRKFAKCLFEAKRVRIVGFDVLHDMEALRTIPTLKEEWPLENMKNVVCLKHVIEILFDIDPKIMDLEKKTCRLGDVTQKVLGTVLDKSEQASNWECRPLRKSQIVYAAMDAVVVLEVFKKAMANAKDYKGDPIDMEKVLEEASILAPRKEKKVPCVPRKLNTVPWEEIYETLRSHRDPEMPLARPCDIKIIIDKMIMGVGRNLLLLGFDVLVPTDVNDFYETILKLMSLKPEERRWLVTVQSKRTDRMRAEYDESKIIAIVDSSNKTALENLCDIFDRFNVNLLPEDDFYQKSPEELSAIGSTSKSSASTDSVLEPSN